MRRDAGGLGRRASLALLSVLLLAFPESGRPRGGEPAVEEPVPGLRVTLGPLNGARIERGGKSLAVYGDPAPDPAPADVVLFTHHRRDVVWEGRALVERGAKAVVPAAEASLFADVETRWREFLEKRFHDYEQQTTKLLAADLRPDRTVRGGDAIAWQGLEIRVLDTPGYTRGAVTYLVRLEGKLVAFPGDLIYGDGKLFDLYSLQDAIPEAKIGGYHGYAARLADAVASARKLAAERPDLIVPARGPLIRDPAAAAERLLARIDAFYRNYLSVDALRWYFGDGHIEAKARRVLGPEAKVEWMPMAETIREQLPSWIVPIHNARLVLASDRSGFLVDCGGKAIVEELERLRAAGKLTRVEHIFVTHYHDDHTHELARFAAASGATVHASARCRDVLENPGAYRLPAMTPNPIHVSGRAFDGARWRWKEFEVALFYFPGQTLYHDALLVRKDGGEEVFFIGDSFTPSGIDDYCLLNRNFLYEGAGYFRCLDLVRREAPQALLVNQHVGPAFRFSAAELETLRSTLERRIGLLRELLPWDDPNFGLDEGWARIYPYALRLREGEGAALELRILNHAPREQAFSVRWNVPAGLAIEDLGPNPIRIPPRGEGAAKARISAPSGAEAGVRVLTADLRFGEVELREWTEGLVEVAP
ncbi:MAG: MBL fold metallo-hydrolase [Planctomycetota bacterium]